MNPKQQSEQVRTDGVRFLEETIDDLSARIEFTSLEELRIIRNDQEVFLYSNHKGHLHKCTDLSGCPEEHFDEAVDPMEIAIRQALLKKLRKAGGRDDG